MNQTTETAVATTQPVGELMSPADILGMAAADQGLKREFKTEELAIPFLRMFQSNSPEILEGGQKYIPGAKAGMIFNTVTKEVFDGKGAGLVISPAAFMKAYVQWVPRDSGGGFVSQHLPGDPIVGTAKLITEGKKKVNRLPNGNDLVETDYFYCTYINPANNSVQWAIISMTSSQLKKSRLFSTAQNNRPEVQGPNGPFRPVEFFWTYVLRTVLETNKRGENFYNWEITNGPAVTNTEMYLQSRNFAKSVKEGTARVTAPPAEHEAVPADDSVPF